MKNGLTELVFILDKSGSMTGLERETINGYNSMLAKQQAVDGECRLTTVLFSCDYRLLHDRIDIRAVSKLTEREYQCSGYTALLDAIGRTVEKIGNAQMHTSEEFRAEKVMVVIITDGEENSSREFSLEKIKSIIERQKAKYGWEFIFLGANIDAVTTAGSYGISKNRAADYLADSAGTDLNFQVLSETVLAYRRVGFVAEDCLDNIRNDVKKRRR
jgi:uncharacterized protein YegL